MIVMWLLAHHLILAYVTYCVCTVRWHVSVYSAWSPRGDMQLLHSLSCQSCMFIIHSNSPLFNSSVTLTDIIYEDILIVFEE